MGIRLGMDIPREFRLGFVERGKCTSGTGTMPVGCQPSRPVVLRRNSVWAG